MVSKSFGVTSSLPFPPFSRLESNFTRRSLYRSTRRFPRFALSSPPTDFIRSLLPHLSHPRNFSWTQRPAIIDTSSGRIPSTSTARNNVKIGRGCLPYQPVASTSSSKTPSRPYALTKPSLIVLQKLAACLSLAEPVLMVGETGKLVGVGDWAEMTGRRLTAIN